MVDSFSRVEGEKSTSESRGGHGAIKWTFKDTFIEMGGFAKPRKFLRRICKKIIENRKNVRKFMKELRALERTEALRRCTHVVMNDNAEKGTSQIEVADGSGAQRLQLPRLVEPSPSGNNSGANITKGRVRDPWAVFRVKKPISSISIETFMTF